MKRLKVLRKVLPIGELELLLAALLDGCHRNISLARSVAQESGTKFFVNQNANVILWDLVRNGLLKACIDDVLTVGNGDHLLHVERFFPAEESRDVGRAMIEGEEIEWSRISRNHEQSSFFAMHAASCSTWVMPICLLETPCSCCDTFRLVSIHANSVWKESGNLCNPLSCGCRVTWS